MDPWKLKENTSINVKIVENSSNSYSFPEFEDNFIDCLPDSKEYIAILEAKLKKLKSDFSVIQQLQEKREACMREFLKEDLRTGDTEEYFLEEHQSVSILRSLAPEKQALCKGEIVELLKYDQLTNETDNKSEGLSED